MSYATGAHGQAPYYYYDADGLGAHAFYNPQNFIVQGGLGALYDEPVTTFDWRGGFSTVNASLLHPLDAVGDYGWKRFLYREFVPHLGPGQNYVPNWVWHFMGGGMRTKLMEEYYTDLGLRYPRVLAWLTMYSYHYVNEAVQAARFKQHDRTTIDPIADLGFFDWAGGVFFRFDAVNRVMSERLHMREWSYQAQWNPFTQRLMNNGQLYWLRRELVAPVSLSLLTGEQITSLNLMVGWGMRRQLSAGIGPKSKAFIARKNGDTDASAIVFSAGIYYSVNDNPLVTLTYEPKGQRDGKSIGRGYDPAAKCLLNLYPSVLRVFGHPIGMSLAYQRDALFVGISSGFLPAGLALPIPRSHGIFN